MRSLRLLLVLVLTLPMSGLSHAVPAYWYRWQSKLDGKYVCAQVHPGEGWQKIGGPFRNARCRNPG
jgi:hypothetical protein